MSVMGIQQNAITICSSGTKVAIADSFMDLNSPFKKNTSSINDSNLNLDIDASTYLSPSSKNLLSSFFPSNQVDNVSNTPTHLGDTNVEVCQRCLNHQVNPMISKLLTFQINNDEAIRLCSNTNCPSYTEFVSFDSNIIKRSYREIELPRHVDIDSRTVIENDECIDKHEVYENLHQLVIKLSSWPSHDIEPSSSMSNLIDFEFDNQLDLTLLDSQDVVSTNPYELPSSKPLQNESTNADGVMIPNQQDILDMNHFFDDMPNFLSSESIDLGTTNFDTHNFTNLVDANATLEMPVVDFEPVSAPIEQNKSIPSSITITKRSNVSLIPNEQPIESPTVKLPSVPLSINKETRETTVEVKQRPSDLSKIVNKRGRKRKKESDDENDNESDLLPWEKKTRKKTKNTFENSIETNLPPVTLPHQSTTSSKKQVENKNGTTKNPSGLVMPSTCTITKHDLSSKKNSQINTDMKKQGAELKNLLLKSVKNERVNGTEPASSTVGYKDLVLSVLKKKPKV